MHLNTVPLIKQLLPYADIERGVIRNSDKKKIQSPQLLLKQLLDGAVMLQEPKVTETTTGFFVEVDIIIAMLKWQYTGIATSKEKLYENLKLEGFIYPTGRFKDRKYIAVSEHGVLVRANHVEDGFDSSYIRPDLILTDVERFTYQDHLAGFELVYKFR